MTPRTPVRATLAVVLILATAALAGCVGAEDEEEGEGDVAVYVKDAATDEFESIFVAFTEVRVHEGDEGEDEVDEANESAGAGWHTVFEGEEEIDLMAFSETDSRAFLGEESLAAGLYNQIVIEITAARGVTTEGDDVDITVTTGQARIVRAFQVEADSSTRLIIDVDLDRSVREQGTQGWRMTPVIGKVLVEEDVRGPEGDVRDDGTEGTAGGATSDGATGTGGGTSDTGRMTTYVKDAPTDEFSEIWIAFDEVSVHFAGNDDDTETNDTDGNGTAGDDTATNETADDTTGDDTGDDTSDANQTEGDGAWVVVVDTPRELDLLRFQDEGSKAFLGEAELRIGKYTQIRVNITEAWGIDVDDGSRVDITVSSGTAKVVKPFDIDANATTQVVIDLDLDRSLVQTGGGQGGQGGQAGQGGQSSWRLTPVIGSVQVERGIENDPRADEADASS